MQGGNKGLSYPVQPLLNQVVHIAMSLREKHHLGEPEGQRSGLWKPASVSASI
jgi:hypothetical protein